MKYFEKLKLPEWTNKRTQILKRDNYSCQCCGLKYKENWIDNQYLYLERISVSDLIFDKIENNYYESYKISNKENEIVINLIPNHYPSIDKIEDLIIISHQKQSDVELSDFVATNNISETNQSSTKRNISNLNGNLVYKKSYEYSHSKITFHPFLTFLTTKRGMESLKHTKLNVHHKKYIIGSEPWGYENDDLITLCTYCHMLVHLEYNIPLYQNGEVKYFLEQCSRCHGERIFPEYEHVLNGCCFRCNGVGFEPYHNDYFSLFK
jgi:hypothetical protein